MSDLAAGTRAIKAGTTAKAAATATTRHRVAAELAAWLTPLIFGFGPIVGMLLAARPVMLPPFESVARMSVVVSVVCTLLYILARIGRGAMAASNMVAMPMFLIAMYPTMHSLVMRWSWLTDPLLGSLYLAACLLAAAIAARMPLEATRSMHQFLVMMAAAFLTFSAVVFVRSYGRPPAWPPGVSAAVANLSRPLALNPQVSSRPDVYHLVLDGMGRADVLEAGYGVRMKTEIERFRQSGFTVADRGFANYVQTHLSLSSMLNVGYLDELCEAQGASRKRAPMRHLISHARVPATFKRLGYEVEFIGSGYLGSGTFAEPDVCDCPQLWLAEPEVGALSLTPLNMFLLSGAGHFAHHRRSLAVFDAFERERFGAAPRYVFAHSPMPHPPFVADADGAFINPRRLLSGADASWFPGTKSEYLYGYRAQATFVLERTLAAVTRILDAARRQNRDVVVIVHGDHGPRAGMDARAPTAAAGRLALPIFLAIHWPGAAPDPPVVSPVNIYRTLFRTYFGLDLPPVEDVGYVSAFDAPYVVFPVKDLN